MCVTFYDMTYVLRTTPRTGALTVLGSGAVAINFNV